MGWRSADALFETFEEEFKVWDRAELETHTTRVREYVPPRLRTERVTSTKTHCGRGHEFTPENTYRRKSGGRECLACRRERRKY